MANKKELKKTVLKFLDNSFHIFDTSSLTSLKTKINLEYPVIVGMKNISEYEWSLIEIVKIMSGPYNYDADNTLFFKYFLKDSQFTKQEDNLMLLWLLVEEILYREDSVYWRHLHVECEWFKDKFKEYEDLDSTYTEWLLIGG